MCITVKKCFSTAETEMLATFILYPNFFSCFCVCTFNVAPRKDTRIQSYPNCTSRTDRMDTVIIIHYTLLA